MSKHRIYYAILHTPSDTLFPFLARGSSWFDFKAENLPIAPRLFLERWRAAAYLTSYLKGPLKQDDEGYHKYHKPNIPRNREDFQLVTINMEITHD